MKKNLMTNTKAELVSTITELNRKIDALQKTNKKLENKVNAQSGVFTVLYDAYNLHPKYLEDLEHRTQLLRHTIFYTQDGSITRSEMRQFPDGNRVCIIWEAEGKNVQVHATFFKKRNAVEGDYSE